MAGNTEIVKGIFQLEVDHTALDKGLKDVAGSYAKVTTEVTKQNEKLQALTAEETKLLEARSKANNPNMVIAFDKKLAEVKGKIADINAETVKLSRAQGGAVATTDRLGRSMSTAFNKTAIAGATNQVRETNKAIAETGQEVGKTERKIVDTTNAWTKLRQDIKAAKGDLAAALETGDEEQIQAATIKVGQLQDKFNDLNESARAFASGSKFQQVGNLLGDVGTNLLSLDFGRAREQSEALLKVSRTITFKETIKGVKDLGATFLNLGASLLTNPLFLLAAVIIAIKVAYDFWNENLSENALRIKAATLELEKQQLINKVLIAQIERQIVLTNAQRGSEEAVLALKARKAKLEQQELQKSIELSEAKKKQIEDTDDWGESFLKAAGSIFEAIGLSEDAANADKALGKRRREQSKEVVDAIIDDTNKLKDSENNLLADQIILAKKRQDQMRVLVENLKKEQDKLKQFDIDFKLSPDSEKQIKEKFQLQRDELKRTQDEEKRLALIEFAGFSGRKKALGLINAKFSAQNKLLAEQEAKEIADKDIKLKLERLDIIRKIDEQQLEIAAAQNTLNEQEIAEERIVILAKFFNDKIALLEGNIKREQELGLSTVQAEKELAAFRNQANVEQIQAQDTLSKIIKQKNLDRLEEETRHSDEMIKLQRSTRLEFGEIEQDRQIEDLNRAVVFEKKKLDILIASNEATKEEIDKQNNAVKEKEAELTQTIEAARRQRILIAIDGTKQIFDSVASAANQALQSQIDNIDKLTSAQEQRIEDAKKLAETGNSQILELEQERQDQLLAQKEQAVRRQQTLATAELAINSAIAISKAAAEGGAAAPFTIAATVIALLAGLAKARQIASQAAFYEGGMYEGYTGDGNPRGESTALGRKPYTYHNKEFIFNHKTTNKYRDIFEGVHKGKINLNDWREKAKAMDSMTRAKGAELANNSIIVTQDNSNLEAQLRKLTKTVEAQAMYINMDGGGFNMYLRNIESRNEYIKKIARP